MNCPKCRKSLVSAQGGSLLVCLEHGVMSKGPKADANVNAYGRYDIGTHTGVSGRTHTQLPPNAKSTQEGQQRAGNGIVSAGEALFMEEWQARYPELPFVSEHRFHIFRDWQIDFCWPDVKVAVEMEGMDHRKTQRYASDLAKYNALADGDWALYRCTMKTLIADADRFCRMVSEKIRSRQ